MTFSCRYWYYRLSVILQTEIFIYVIYQNLHNEVKNYSYVKTVLIFLEFGVHKDRIFIYKYFVIPIQTCEDRLIFISR